MIALTAILDLPKQHNPWGKLQGLLLSDLLLIFGVGLGIVVLLGAAIYFWKRRLRHRRRHISSGEKVYRGTSETDESSDHEHDDDSDEHEDDTHHSNRRRYKYRARRRTHRTRNPTLSETGGLPPVKPHESGKPC